MAFTYNSAGKVEGNVTSNPVSFSYTAGTNSKLVVLSLTAHNNVPTDVSSGTPTYNGLDMTKCGSTQITAEGTTEQWYYLTPDGGTARTISISNASGNELHYVCTDYTNPTANAAHFGHAGSGGGTVIDVTVSIDSVPDGAVVVSCMVHGEKDQFASITGATSLHAAGPSTDEG